MNLKKEICPCYHVTKSDIVKAFVEGATSYKDIKKATKAGKACGKCKKKVKKLVKKLEKQNR
ncbi:MAG: (2Fe-2S)-binding protein [Anaerovoracaceae bacterium]|nr:(2Fe-2S)-binding protein [Anaerovoracaceae bacterium]